MDRHERWEARESVCGGQMRDGSHERCNDGPREMEYEIQELREGDRSWRNRKKEKSKGMRKKEGNCEGHLHHHKL